jgi:hypothetical protein
MVQSGYEGQGSENGASTEGATRLRAAADPLVRAGEARRGGLDAADGAGPAAGIALALRNLAPKSRSIGVRYNYRKSQNISISNRHGAPDATGHSDG